MTSKEKIFYGTCYQKIQPPYSVGKKRAFKNLFYRIKKILSKIINTIE
jgi:hypothetical protein